VSFHYASHAGDDSARRARRVAEPRARNRRRSELGGARQDDLEQPRQSTSPVRLDFDPDP